MRASINGSPCARAQSGSELTDLSARVGDRYDLVEGFLLANHAEIGASALFRGITALLEVDNFGIERPIAQTQVIIDLPLLGDSIAQFQGLPITVVRKPQLSLQTQSGQREQNEQRA